MLCNTEIENMQSDSSKGDTELQLLRKQMADERLKKEQVRHLLLFSLLLTADFGQQSFKLCSSKNLE